MARSVDERFESIMRSSFPQRRLPRKRLNHAIPMTEETGGMLMLIIMYALPIAFVLALVIQLYVSL